MENTSLMQLCHVGAVVCAIIFIIGLVLGIVLFVKYDIPLNIAIRTGRTERISLKKVKEDVLKTGRLKKVVDLDYETGGKNNKRPKTRNPILSNTMNVQNVIHTGTDYGVNGFRFDLVEEIVDIHSPEYEHYLVQTK